MTTEQLLSRTQNKTFFKSKKELYEWLNHLGLIYDHRESEQAIVAYHNPFNDKQQKYVMLCININKGYYISKIYKRGDQNDVKTN